VSSRTAAILPVKRFSRAKQRLGESIDDGLRLALAAAMVQDVLSALADTPELAFTIVVTSEPSVAEDARAHGALVMPDSEDQGQAAAASLGIAQALREGAERVICVPGDCPALDPAELGALLREEHSSESAADPPVADASSAKPQQACVVIVPDRHGTGTNGLLLAPPLAIAPSFGPGSCARHRELAAAAGAACSVRELPTLLLDIDTGADLAALRERLAAHPGRAARTRAVLAGARRATAGSTHTA
jgi:2-phospho-L-lactate/phosphoenolpyruvate guanylyltransferase